VGVKEKQEEVKGREGVRGGGVGRVKEERGRRGGWSKARVVNK